MASAEDKPRPNPEALARSLQESLRQRRFRPWRIFALVLGLAVAALAILGWALVSERAAPEVGVLALDSVAASPEVPQARAILVAADSQGVPFRRAGYDVLFLDHAVALQPGAAPRQEKASTDKQGYAQLAWPLPLGAPEAPFDVRYVDVRRRKGNTDRGHIYAWPKDSVLLLIDVADVLAEVPPERGPNAFAAVPLVRPGAAEALHALRDEARVVYLLPNTEPLRSIIRLRDWVKALFESRPAFPPGPVFSRLDYADAASSADVRRGVVAEVRRHFAGPQLAVVHDPAAVATYKEEGIPAIWLGPGAPEADLPQAADWNAFAAEARKQFAKK